MAKRRIKKPVRKKKSDYPGEMSFRKALGMNPTYYQEGGKLYYQEDTGDLPTTKYGTPEYEEAYRTGNLLVNGVKPLPEFKVTPEYKSLSDELKRAAIIGTKEAAELTGVPGAVRFARSPVQSLKGAGNTIVDLGLMAGAGLSPVGRFGQMNPMGGAQYAKQGTNPLTGQGSFRAEDVEGAFNTLDAATIATIAGAGLKAPLQQGAKRLAKSPVVDYAKEFGHSIKKGKLPTYESTYRWQPDIFPERLVEAGKTLTPLQQGLTGSWYTKYPHQLAFYMRSRPGAGNVNRIRLSDRQIANLESSMPDYAKGMSGKSGVNRVPTSNTSMPGELIVPESIRSKSVPMRFQINPIDYSPQSVADEITKRRSKLKNLLDNPDFLPGDIDRTIQNEVIEEHAKNIYIPMLKAQEQPILGIPRKYFPFKDGGSLPTAQVGKLYYQEDKGFIPDRYSESFKQAVRSQENSIRSGWNEVEKKWYPHKSVEGGTNTIAYGHKLNPKESYPKGLTEQEALKLFEKDFAIHEKIAKDYVNEKYKKDVFSTLSRPKQLLLTDYAFNGVLKKFPSFSTAIVEDNYDKMIKEYERYSGGKPLKSRNKWTKEYIDANFAPKKQIKNKRFGGKLRYARGGSLTSAQDTAQAANLNKDVMRKDIKKASVGEDFMAGLYGVGEGLLDTVTFGLTDELTDAGFKALQAGAGHDVNSDEAKRQAGIAGWGNVAGAVTGAIINPGAIGSAAEEGLEGIGTGIEGIDPSSDIATGIGTSLKGMAGSKVLGGLNDKDKIPEGMQGFSKLFMARNGGRFKYGYRGGGHMVNQNMGLTEIDGPSHEQGGVTLPNSGGRPDVEVEGPETIYTPENYVMSEKMKASKEALEYAGITGKAASRLAGKSYADLSKSIKSKAGDKLRPADPLSKKMLDKEMKRLMMAHEYDREAKRMKDEAMRSQMMGGSNVVAETPEQRAGGYNMYPNAESIAFPGNGATSVVPTNNNDPIMVTGADGSQQMLTDEPIETEAPFIEEKMAQGGKMIKRADGSYSKRGLWDNIRANRGSGRKPTKQMLEQEAKIKAAEKAYGGYYADGGKMPTEVLRSRLESHMSPQEADNYLEQYADGGSFNNPGFRALPGYVQDKIKSNMALGGFMGDYIDEDDTMEYGEGGYTVRRSNDRKGKTHVVTGPDGTKKYFGDPNLGERGKSKYGKDAFYARHKKNLDNNPHFRAYARATWEDGGYMNMLNSNVDMVDMETPMYEYGGSMMYGQGGGIHIDPSKRGTFKAQASRMGMGVQQAASSILNAPEGKYSPAMRKKANFARNFAKADGGYMYQMGGEMMAQQPQGGGQEEIMQQVAQMLQQGMAPEEIVGQLVQMGVPQEQAIQIVQMIVQQMQGQQQAPQQAPPMMRRGGYMYQMGGEMAPQQAPQQGGDQEQIMQAIVQMLQQGLQPEQIVGELVKMGIPQEAAIQAVQMVMEQVQQSQGMQQQQQAAPPFEQGMMGQQQGAPATMRGGGRMYQMGGSLADTYLQNLNKPKPLFRNGGKLYYQQNKGYLIPNNMYSPEAVSTPDDYERIYDIVGNTLDRETALGYPNYGFTQSGATQYANTPEGRNQAINAGIDQYFNKYGLYEMPDSQQAMAFDFAFNSEDPRASMMVAANKLTPAEKVGMYSQGKLDPNKVNQAWEKSGANVMAMGDALNDPFAAEKIRSYTGTKGANTKLPEWTNRVNQVKAFAPKYFSNNNSQSNSLYTSVPVPTGTLSTTTSNNTTVGSTPAGKPENYQQWQPNTAPIVAGGLSAGITPIANLVASITGRDTRAAAPLKFEKPDYTPVAIQRAAANQALANTREALRRGSPTQGNYLSNLTVTAPSLAANVGREIANKRFEIGKSRAEIDMREQVSNDQNRKFNIMNQARDQAAREQLRLEAARGFSTIGQGVTKDLGETLYEANILRNLETKDFSPFNYIRDEKGRFKQVLSPRGAAIYRDNTTNNQIVTDDQGNSYMILPGGKIQLIQKK